MTGKSGFQALDIETLGARLAGVPAVADRVGPDGRRWKVREVGDGNLNLVFIVEGPKGSVVVKQALPYVRLVGESWPLPLKRSFFEYHALIRQEARAGFVAVPAVYHFDEAQALIVMEYLTPHVILRRALIEGRMPQNIGRDLGLFAARTLFRGSDLSMTAGDRKRDLALFADNVELCDITESLVFTEPYFDAPRNRHTSPQLDAVVGELRADRDLKVEAQRLKHLFAAKAETLLHGDLHTGSIMVTDEDMRVIDPEFAWYGPMAFDVGMLLANFWMSFFSQRGHERNGDRKEMREWLLGGDCRGLVGISPGVRPFMAYRAHRHALRPKPVRGSQRRAWLGAGAERLSCGTLDRPARFRGCGDSPSHTRPCPQCRLRDNRGPRHCARIASGRRCASGGRSRSADRGFIRSRKSNALARLIETEHFA